jgi:hypothetical protein
VGGVSGIFGAEGAAGRPALGGEDFVAEAGGGFGPLGVVWVRGDFCAATRLLVQGFDGGEGGSMYFLGPASPIVSALRSAMLF